MTDNNNFAETWERVIAYLLDAIIVGVLSFVLNYFNFLNAKNFYVYLLILIIGVLYKPYMESHFGQTLGKMAFKIKVIDYNNERIDLKQSLLRSSILIIPVLVYIPVQYMAFNNPDLISINGFYAFTKAVSKTYSSIILFSNIGGVLFLIDFIVLVINRNKTHKSLKDIMAETYVVKN